MRASLRVLIAVIVSLSFTRAEDNLRSGTPKDCFLYSLGKGPDWTAKVSTEFQLALLNSQRPYIDEQYFDPTENALAWTKSSEQPNITTIATVDGRKVIQVVYRENGSLGDIIRMILLAIETDRASDWYSPFFGAQPELFGGQFVSSKDVLFGYIATLEWSGTGAFRTHYLFDLRGAHPKIVSTLSVGRVRRTEFQTEAEYEQALKVFDREAELLSGQVRGPDTSKSVK